MKELKFEKELTLISQISQRNYNQLNIGYKFEPYAHNKCHDISMMAYELEIIAILNVEDIDYRCVL